MTGERAVMLVYKVTYFEEFGYLNSSCIRIETERRESLSIKLFEDIANNEHHKLANLLPQMSSSHTRRFNTPACRTDRFMNSFIISYAM